MYQLSMTDAFMLAAENERQTLQVGSLSILAPPADGEAPVTRQVLRDLVARRIHLAPALCRKLLRVPLGLDHPYWVDDPVLDIDYHVRDLALTPPGSDRQLAEKVAQIISQPLDHSRPLWELHLIHGLEGGRSAVLFKLHHASVDGISALELHEMLFDRGPEGREVLPSIAASGERVPSKWAMLGRGLASLPGQVVRAVYGGLRSLPYLDQLMPFRVTPGFGTVSRATRRLARRLRIGGEGMLLEGEDLRVPRTMFDRPITPHRRWAFARVPLDEAKRVKRHFGVTLNDVVVATIAGAVREWLQELDELPDDPLVALVPVSVRNEDDDAGGNRVEVMLVPLPTDQESPERRIMLTHQALRRAKERHKAVPASAMHGASHFIMPALFGPASRAATLIASLGSAHANLVMSNVPGPPTSVYVAGARVEELYPVGGLVEGFGFTTIVFSYAGGLHLGFVVDRDSRADPWRLAAAFERSQRELLAHTPRQTARSVRPAAQPSGSWLRRSIR
jgi:diacylglycerol O-acyltransferase / wax synthase